MFCQLDHVKEILDMAEVVRKALLEVYPDRPDLQGCSKEAGAAVFAVLLLQEYDVFLQEGVINTNGEANPHHWVELYLDGEAFVLDVTLTQFGPMLNQQVPAVLLMPGEDAAEEFGYGESREIAWQPDFCTDSVMQRVLNQLKLPMAVEQLLEQVGELAI